MASALYNQALERAKKMKAAGAVSSRVQPQDKTGWDPERSDQFNQIRQKLRQQISSGNYVSDVTDADVGQFLQDARTYAIDTEKQLTTGGWFGTMDPATSAARASTARDLNDREIKIRQWAGINKATKGDEWYGEMVRYLDDFRKSQSIIDDEFKRSSEYYSQWDSQNAYDEYRNSDQYEKDIREAGYYQKYGQMSFTQLRKAAAALSDGEEKEWLTTYAPSQKTESDLKEDLTWMQGQLEYIEHLKSEGEKLAGLKNQLEAKSPDAPGYAQLEAQYDAMLRKYPSLTVFEDIENRLEKAKTDIYKKENEIKYYGLSANEDYSKLSRYTGNGSSWYGGGSLLDEINDPDHADVWDTATTIGKYVPITPGANIYSNIQEIWNYENTHLMTDEERSNFNYLWNKEGEDAAKDYMDYLQPTLNERSNLKVAQFAAKVADKAPVLTSLLSTPVKLLGGLGLADASAQKLIRDVSGEWKPIDYNRDGSMFSTAANVGRSVVSQKIVDATGVVDFDEAEHPILAKAFNGKSLADLYNLGMSMQDSAAVAAMAYVNPALAKVGTALLATSSGTDAMLDAVSRGATDDQAITMGILAAGFEYIFEKYELESLLGQGRNIWTAAGKQALSEAAGEGATEICNIIADAAVMGEQSNWQTGIQAYIDAGLSPEEAKKRAFIDNCVQVGWSAAGGFASGGIMGGGMAGINTVSGKIADRNDATAVAKDLYQSEAGRDRLMELAREIAAEQTGRSAKRMNSKIEKVGKEATLRNTRGLYRTVSAAYDGKTESDVVKSLTRKGFSKRDAAALGKALTAEATGGIIGPEESGILEKYQYDDRLRETRSNLLENEKSTVNQRRQNLSGLRVGAALDLQVKQLDMEQKAADRFTELGETENTEALSQAAVKSVIGQKLTAEEKKLLKASEHSTQIVEELKTQAKEKPETPATDNTAAPTETTTTAHQEASTEGVAVRKDTGAPVTIKEVAAIKDGRMTLRLEDGAEVDNANIAHGSELENMTYEAVASLEGMIGPKVATKMINHMLQLGEPVSDSFVSGVTQAYKFGYMGYHKDSINNRNTMASQLTERQRNISYRYGMMQKAADDAAPKRVTNTKGKKSTAKGNKAPDGKTTYENVEFEGRVRNWGEKQQAEVAFMDFVARELAGGVTVHVYESYVGSNGKRYYRDHSGKAKAAPNGKYDPSTGDLYVDLAAGNNGEGLVLNTFAHELYHHIEKWSPAKARQLTEFLVKEMGVSSVESMVEKQIEKAEDNGHGVKYFMDKGMSKTAAENIVRKRAFSDFVADSLETVFTRKNAPDVLKRLHKEDKSLFNRIKDFIDRWVKKLREFYKGNKTISQEGHLASQLKTFEHIQEMFMEAMSDAEENYRKGETVADVTEAQKNTAEGGDDQFSIRRTQKMTLKEQLSAYYGKEFKQSDSFYFGETPVVLSRSGLEVLPLAFGQDDFKKSTRDKHNIPRRVLNKLSENLKHPIFSFVAGKQTAIVIDDIDGDGKPVVVAIHGGHTMDRKPVNVIKSIYGINTMNVWIEQQIKGGSKFRVYDVKKANALLQTQGYLAAVGAESDGYWDIISPQYPSVNDQFSDRNATSISKRDAAYMDAVNRGDMKTAQKMVDSAAKASGYNKLFYHGSKKGGGFTVFRDWSYFTESKQYAQRYADRDNPSSLYTTYVKMESPFDTRKSGHRKLFNEIRQEYGLGDIQDSGLPDWTDGYDISDYIDENGLDFDTIILDEGGDLVNGEPVSRGLSYVIRKSSQIKSADPIAYDDNGNVIPLSKRFNQENEDIRFSDRNTPLSNRALLANALTSAVQNEDEAKTLSEYEYKVSQIEAVERHLSELRKNIYEMTFRRGSRDDAYKAELEKLKADALRTERRLNRLDKELLGIEAMKPVADILKREKAAVRKREKAKYDIKLADYQKDAEAEMTRRLQEEKNKAARKRTELREKYYKDRQKALADQRAGDSDKRKRMEMRKQIRKDIRELTKMLKRGRDERNVKEEMKDLAASTIAQAEALFIDYYTDNDIIRNGIMTGQSLRSNESTMMNEANEILKQLDNPASDIYDPTAAAQEQYLRGRLSRLKSQLKEVFVAERNRMDNATASELMNGIFKAYKALESSDKEYVRNAYDPQVLEHLQGITERFDNVKARDMSLRQLEDLHKAYTMVLHTIRTANKAFTESRSVEQLAKALVSELRGKQKISKTKLMTMARNAADMIGWNYEKLYYALERVGSDTLTRLFNNLANSENIVMQDAMEAKAVQLDLIDKYGYNEWDINKQINQDFVDSRGKTFRMTLGEMMLLYAYVRRGTVYNQLETGGFVFGEKALVEKLKKTDTANAYKLTRNQCISITNLLSDEQKRFVEAMQDYLSDTMGAKGNEVSMQLYGVELFDEKHYMPVHVAGEYHSRAEESKAKAEAGFASMKNAGFTKSKNVEAKAPIVLESFMDVWVDHVNEMSRYHGTVPALEDIRRVMNYSVYNDANTDSVSVQAALKNSCGEKAVNYFDSLYREANSGAVMDRMQDLSKQALAKMRKLGVAYSLSVVVQQPASLVRAYSMINKKYFGDIRIPGLRGIGTLPASVVKTAINRWTQSQTNAYAEMLKYAPGVTMAKEIGGFDTASGGSIRTYLMDDGKSLKQKVKTGTGTEKVKAIADVVDDNPIANVPNLADKMTWIEIWNACKRETKDKYRNLTVGSDQFMKKVGERFTEVIRATQVYDSMFSKSPLLKSKNAAVQYIVSFMNEPNTVANMVESAFRNFRKGKKLEGAKKIGAVVRSTIFTCVLKSLVYAMRDDDEDETYIEKYVQALSNNLIGDFTGFNYIPFVGDIWSMYQGYDVERPDLAIYADVIDDIKKYSKLHSQDVSDMTPGELDEWERSCTAAGWSLIGSIAGCFGIPVKNITREVKAVFNVVEMCGNNVGPTTWETFKDAAWQGIADELPGADTEKSTDKLYQAIIENDQAYLDRLKAAYVDPDGNFKENSYATAIRKGLRANDARIRTAAEARKDMNTEEYLRIIEEIVAEGYFSEDDVVAAVRSEYNSLKGDDVSTQLYDAIASGDDETAEDLKGSYTNDKGKFSETSYRNAIRKGLRENEPRIQKAAEAKAAGDTDTYLKIVEEIVDEGHFKWKDVSAAVKALEKELEEEEN